MTTEKGVKLDSGKPRLDLVLGEFRNALWQVGEVGTIGAVKYTDNGWQEVDNAKERYLSAMFRHYLKYKNGMFVDSETGLPHLAHMAWNALAVLELSSRQGEGPIRQSEGEIPCKVVTEPVGLAKGLYSIPAGSYYNPDIEDKPRGL